MNWPCMRLIVFSTRNATTRSLWIGLGLCLSLSAGLSLSWGQDRSTARSMVITRQGIVATSHTLASQAGAPRFSRTAALRSMRPSPPMRF